MEFIYVFKGKTNKNPFGKREKANKNIYFYKTTYYNYNEDNNTNINSEIKYNNNNNLSNNFKSNDNIFFDSKNDKNINENINK